MLEGRKIIRVEILPKIEEKCGVKKSNDLYTVLAPHEEPVYFYKTQGLYIRIGFS